MFISATSEGAISNKQIQETVVIVIAPGATDRISRVVDQASLRDTSESAVTIVVV